MELLPDSLAELLRRLNPAQLTEALRTGDRIEARHRGARYVLAPLEQGFAAQAEESVMRMGSLKELASIPAISAPGRAGVAGAEMARAFLGITTNVPVERLPAATAIQWAMRARTARMAFAPVQIVIGRPAAGDGVLTWRNHRNLQFLTHRLRCHLRAEWSARGETRPVEDVLRDLQEVHRATLTVDGAVVRRLPGQPSPSVAAVLDRLGLWELFQTPDCGKK